MNDEIEKLIERWILAFCETPPLLDAELMGRVLDQHQRSPGADDR